MHHVGIRTPDLTGNGEQRKRIEQNEKINSLFEKLDRERSVHFFCEKSFNAV